MKFNVSNMASKVNSAVGVAAGITVGIAITLSAAVYIKRCIKDLLPAKKTENTVEIHVKPEDATMAAKDATMAAKDALSTVEIHVIRRSDKNSDGEQSDTKPEYAAMDADEK